MAELHGTCPPELDAVRQTMAANFDAGVELGAGLCVTVEGETVVDLWGGDRDLAGNPWERDTICNVWSTTKTMAALVLYMLADRGQLDFDAPVADYWPEFAAAGKHGVLVRHILGHTAGVPAWEPAIGATDLADHDRCATALAVQPPWWEPGTMAGYHAITQGYLENELVRRTDGRTLGTFFADEVAGPLGADFHIGLPESEEHRVAWMVTPADVSDLDSLETNPLMGSELNDLARRALRGMPGHASACNERWWRAAEIPAANGTGNARSVGRVHAALACGGSLDGVELVSPDLLKRIGEVQFEGMDPLLGATMRYGIGFGLISDAVPLSPSPHAYFWGGWGGSLALIDPDRKVTISYIMNRMGEGLDLRGAMLVFAANQALRIT
jgi:CubicO group peptidase (beta-lactamase class C family)